jgi:hypothetical protein
MLSLLVVVLAVSLIMVLAEVLVDIKLAPLQSEHIQFLQLFRLVLALLGKVIHNLRVMTEIHHTLGHQ